MTRVFIGGSRRISQLNAAAKARLDNIIQREFTVLIGDANGADRAVQMHLANRGYANVVVYCMNADCRNNLGDWQTRSVPSDARRRDFQYYSIKDREMARDATHGFMLWDGHSKGTLNNVLTLLADRKQVLIYFAPDQTFLTAGQPPDLRPLLARCDPHALEKLRERLRLLDELDLACSQRQPAPPTHVGAGLFS